MVSLECQNLQCMMALGQHWKVGLRGLHEQQVVGGGMEQQEEVRPAVSDDGNEDLLQ